MIYAIMITIVFSFVLIVLNFKNKILWFLFLMCCGLNLLFVSSLLYITKLSNYRTTSFIEKYIYLFVLDLKINFYVIINMCICGIAIFLLSMYCIGKFCFSGIRHFSIKKAVVTLLELLPLFVFMLINSTIIGRKYYLFVNTTENEGLRMLALRGAYIMRYLSYGILVYYMSFPLYVLIKKYRETRILLNRYYSIALGICLILVDGFAVGVFFAGPFKHLLIDNLMNLGVNASWQEYSQYYIYMPFILLVLLDVVFFIINRYKLINKVDFLKKRMVRKKVDSLARDTLGVLHSCKNTLFRIEILADEINEDSETASSENAIKIKQLAEKTKKDLGRVLDVFNDVTLNLESVNIRECIDEASGNLIIPEEIAIDIRMLEEKTFVYADKGHMVSMLENLISNAVTAIKKSSRQDGRIVIYQEQDDEWTVINIYDNGCGIKKENLNKIFQPMFSTKNNSSNWGVGLTYVEKVVSAHLGFIFVESTADKYTKFQILLPQYKGKVT
jgi:hypothetical protein